MQTTGQYVTIKGTKDGLVFICDDSCDYFELVEEMKGKLNQSFEKFIDDTVTNVTLKLGKRQLSEAQQSRLVSVFSEKPNLTVKSIEFDPVFTLDERIQQLIDTDLSIHNGTVRSGQAVFHEGNLLLLGDINPGGSVSATGSLYVMGALRGMAHAGCNGNEQAVIVASQLFPAQLRIASLISRPPDEWAKEDAYMEYAYLHEGQMKLDKLANMHRRK